MQEISVHHQANHKLKIHIDQQKQSSTSNSIYTFYHPLLIKYYFAWQALIFAIDIYYVNQCFFWPTFHQFYQYAVKELLPLNIILMTILLINIGYTIAMTPKLSQKSLEGQSRHAHIAKLKYYFKYNNNGIFVIIYILFFVSFLIPRSVAQYLHLVYLFRLFQIIKFVEQIYNKIHAYKWMRILYSITIMFYNIIYFSHFLGCIFYVIDQNLIEMQYFGDPALYPLNYYQYTSLSFTPIQSLSYIQKYIMAFYFSSGIVTTIAYGDIVGKNYIQDAYVLILFILSTIFIAFILQQFMIMVGDNRFTIFEIIKKYKNLKQLMAQKNVQSNLQIRIRNYLFYVQYYNKFHNSSEVFQKLSTKLQVDLFENGYGPLFMDLLKPFGLSDIRCLTQALSQITYQPETEIYQPEWKSFTSTQLQDMMDRIQSEFLQADLVCLIQGKIYQYLQYSKGSREFRFRRNQTNYNFYQFMADHKVRYGLRSKSLVRAVVLSKQVFLQKIEQLQLRKLIINYRQKIIANSFPRSIFNDSCEICDDLDHSVIDCPEVHYVINGTIKKACQVSIILSTKTNNRQRFKRSSVQSKKQINIVHLSVIFANLNFEALTESQIKNQESPLQLLFLSKIIKNIRNEVQIEQQFRIESDSAYDPQGIDLQWRLPQY